MQTIIERAALALLLGAASFAQTPELIRGLTAMNAASLAAEGMPNAGVAPGARFALFGRALDRSAIDKITARVTIDGAELDVRVLSASGNRIDALLPLHAPLGSGAVTLDLDGVKLTAPIRIVERAFGVFSEPVPGSNGSRLRGTGLGRDDSPVGIEVIVAGQIVPAGGVTRNPDGFEDIDFDVPAGAQSCATPVAVRANGRISNTARLATAPDCPAASPIEPQNHGSISLSRSQVALEGFKQVSDAGSASFLRAPGIPEAAGVYAGLPAGACTLQYFIEQDAPGFPVRGLDAGPRIEVTGPNGARDLELRAKGHYDRELGQVIEASIPGFPPQPGGLFLDPGNYTVNGFGGSDVGPFTARIEVPNPAVWTNPNATAEIDRATDLRIEWRDASAQQIVTFTGISVAGARPLIAAAFACAERGDKGALTAPAYILSALPASSGRNGGQVSFTVTPERPVEFTAAGLDSPGTLDYAQQTSSQARFR